MTTTTNNSGIKDPGAVSDYGMDWSSQGILSDGSVIIESVWFTQTGLNIVTDSFDGPLTAVRVSGGVKGKQYHLTNRVTTDAGQIEEYSWILLIKDK